MDDEDVAWRTPFVLLKLHVTYQSLERTNMVDKTTQVAVCYEI